MKKILNMRKYTNPEAHSYLMEADACTKVLKELSHIEQKLQRAVDKKEAARKKDLETSLQYRSEREIRDDYGYDCITEKQYDLYLEIFREGQEALEKREKTVTELALSIVKRIMSDISMDCQEWKFCALSPKDQLTSMEKA